MSARIKGLVIPGGFLYVGRRLDPVGFGRDVEPALIDPSLPVFLSEPDLVGTSLGYWLSYSRISPRGRAGYLHWLWSGRRNPTAPIGYVFLYFYGLERRALYDGLSEPAAQAELPAIRAEVERLLDIYRNDELFRTSATRFCACLDVLCRRASPGPGAVPEFSRAVDWELPLVVRFELSRIAAVGGRLPADWALAWARHAPDVPLRTPALRCPEQFDRLFELRYGARFGDGLPLTPNRARLRLHYRPTSPSFTGAVTIPTGDLPDPTVLAGPTKKLAALAGSIADELDAYSRLIGKHPEAEGELAAVALLPPELATGSAAEVVDRMVAVMEAELAGSAAVVIDSRLLLSQWPSATPGPMSRTDIASLLRLLAARGFGIEPDLRLGGPALVSGPAVLFRLAVSAAPTSDDSRAPLTTAVLQLLGTVVGREAGAGPGVGGGSGPGGGSGAVGFDEAGGLAERSWGALELSPLPTGRAAAHVVWASTAQPKATGLKRRFAGLPQSRRAAIGRHLVEVASAGRRVSPRQMTALSSAYAVLGLPASELFSGVHEATVTPSSPVSPGGALRTATTTPTTTTPTATTPTAATRGATTSTVDLDPDQIRAKLAETAEVAAFLGRIFVEEDHDSGLPAPENDRLPGLGSADGDDRPEAPGSLIAALDRAHSELLRRLGTRDRWSRAELVDLAAGLQILPDGALDTLNEAALDQTGDPVCEGEDPIEINLHALKELLT